MIEILLLGAIGGVLAWIVIKIIEGILNGRP